MRNGQIKSSGMKKAFLNFDKIKRTDDGLYTCSANNSAGTKTHEEILVVRCESEMFQFLCINLHFLRKQTNTAFLILDIVYNQNQRERRFLCFITFCIQLFHVMFSD